VDVSVFLPAGPGPGQQQERLLVTGTGIFKKLGALRAM
jgi:hypothetical protein